MASLQWSGVVRSGIERDSLGNFHAGRVVDVLFTSAAGMLVASERSGVWVVTAVRDAWPLSTDWSNTDVQSLSFGAGPGHVYAGCTLEYLVDTSELLYETDRSATTPLAAPWRAVAVPAPIRAIWDILVVSKRIVIATDVGIFWSPIPPSGGAYDWAEVSGVEGVAFFSLSRGSGGKVIAGAFAPNGKSVVPLYSGRWLVGFPGPGGAATLEFSAATVPAATLAVMGRTTVDACRSGGYKRTYALSFDGFGTPAALLFSNNGGSSWSVANGNIAYTAATGLTGPQKISNKTLTHDDSAGGRIHRVTVSAVDPELIAFGMIHGYFSRDHGDNFQPIGDWPELWGTTGHPALHDDVHVVAFDPYDPAGKRVVLASDGGVCATSLPTQKGAAWTFSDFNERLNNLQFYSTNAYARTFPGRLDASALYPGVVAGGVQDNGNVYADSSSVEPTWRMLDGNDGGLCVFVEPLGVVRNDAGGTSDVFQSSWQPASEDFTANITIPLHSLDGATTASSVPRISLERVTSPVFSDEDGRLMYAVGCRNTTVYGLFADASGANPAFVPVAAWPAIDGEVLGAVASYDGLWIVGLGAASDGVRIFLIVPKRGKILDTVGRQLANQLPVDHTGGGKGKYVTLIRAASARDYYALYSDRSGSRLSGAILGTTDRGENWQRLGIGYKIKGSSKRKSHHGGRLPDELFFGLAVDSRTSPPRLLAATDRQVYLSTDGGTSWRRASGGLPACPHCSHLEILPAADGSANVYLGTYGWGLWRARVS